MPIPLGILAVAGAGAAGGGAFDLLETVNITATGSTSISFTGLDSYTDYKHLQVRWTAKSSSNQTLNLTFNSDTGTNYARHYLRGTGAAVASSASTSASSISLLDATGGTTNIFAVGVMDILDFSNTNKNTTIRALYGNDTDLTRIFLSSGFWNNTAAVTSMTLTIALQYSIGTRFSLYGVK